MSIDSPRPESQIDAQARKKELLQRRVSAALSTVASPSRIPRLDRGLPVPASFGQRRMWILQQMTPNSSEYHVPIAARLVGPLQPSALRRALEALVERHEPLRTSFADGPDGEPVLRVHGSLSAGLETVDLRGQEDGDTALDGLLMETFERPFDLSSGRLSRALLARTGNEEHVLLIVVHHIAFDGWSASVFQRELAEVYAALTRSEQPKLPELPVTYKDYAAWERGQAGSPHGAQQLDYWVKQLRDLAPLGLHADRARAPERSGRGAAVAFSVPSEVADGLRALARSHNASLFMVLLAAWQVLLHGCTRNEDIAVGTPTAGRNLPEIESLVGCFINTVVLRGDLTGNPTFSDVVERTRDLTLDAFAHQDVPFDHVVERLQPTRSLASTPLFQVLFSLEEDSEPLTLTGCVGTPIELPVTVAQTDLDLALRAAEGGGLEGRLIHATDVIEPSTAARMANHYSALLAKFAADPALPIASGAVLSAEEEDLLRTQWNDTRRDWPDPALVTRRFEQQAARTPDTEALRTEEGSLTYADLDRRSNQLARRLKRLGVGRDVLVGICLERGPDMVVAMLATLKSGGAYVPLDPEFPGDRIAYMLEDSGLAVLLTQRSVRARLDGVPTASLCVDELRRELENESADAFDEEASPQDLAYVIYTSGSTGRPKGVQIPHGALNNFLRAMGERPGIDARDSLLAVTTLSFDIAMLELLLPLVHGARVVLADRATASDGERLSELLTVSGATVMQATPSTWRLLLEVGWRPSGEFKALVGGEALAPELAQRLRATGVDLWNMYGPTETTIWSSVAHVEDESITIGEPIANTELHVLDAEGRLMPLGVPGELCIGGAGLARGYLGRPELTAERFVARTGLAERLYRTGDLVRRRGDGRIEFLGRLDRQVKLRGYRIEPGEIEAALSRQPAVEHGVVTVREDVPGQQRLVAYVVAASSHQDGSLSRTLRAALGEVLPAYMVPTAYVCVDTMPLTPNGKIDHKALPAPSTDGSAAAGAFAAPVGAAEEAVAGAWAEVLGLKSVSRDDDFFELGGSSLLALRVVSRLRERLGTELPLRVLFSARTVHDLAVAAQQAAPSALPSLTPAERAEVAPLSYEQRLMWFLDQVTEDSSTYHVPVVLRLRGRLDRSALHRAILAISDRHEVLRTSLRVDATGEPVLVRAPEATVPLLVHDLRESADREEAVARLVRETVGRPFDLSAEQPLRAELAELSHDENLLIVVVHHIAFDAQSFDLFVRELAAHYNALLSGSEPDLPELPVQYADYAIWQRARLDSGSGEQQVAFWRDRLDSLATLELPTDHPRPVSRSGRGATVPFHVSAELTGQLRALGHQHGATMFMTVLAAWQSLLHRYSGQSDIPVGCAVGGRPDRRTEDLIGFFVNNLVMRGDFAGNPAFSDVLQATRDTVLDAFAHQDLPFERLVEALRPKRDPSRTPLFQVMLNFRDEDGSGIDLDGLATERCIVESTSAKFDLLLYVEDNGAELNGTLEFATDLFEPSTAQRLLDSLCALLRGAVAAPSTAVRDLPVLSAEKWREIVHDWNENAVDLGDRLLVHELVAERARANPSAIALVQGERQVSYGELEERANRLAGYLQSLGVSPDTMVGVCMQRSPDLLVALLGVLKAGGAYVPLDPGYPAERLRFIHEDTQAPILITDTATEGLLPTLPGIALVRIDADWPRIAAFPSHPPQSEADPRNLVYVIYTSGSTGRPKGVQVEHIGLTNYIVWARDHYPRGGERSTVLHSSISFDLTVPSLFEPLVSGKTLTVLPPGDSLELLAEELAGDSSYDYIRLTPSHLRYLRDWFGARGAVPAARGWVVGGEVLEPELVADWQRLHPDSVVINHYAPTEVVIGRVMYFVPEGFADNPLPVVPLGYPMHNTTLLVLDQAMQPVPPGVLGEMYMGGLGVTRGYFRRPGLTAEKFVPDPFGSGGRLYRTGDHVRQHPDGALEFVGRVDHQVKIRGFRIELGEIESALVEHPAVDRCVVQAWRDSGGDQRLAVYWTGSADAADDDGSSLPTVTELRRHVAVRLPEYMVPAAFVHLSSFTFNPHGKIDRHALPVPDSRPDLEAAYLSPRSPGEALMAEIWEEVLDVDRVGIDDNFFELGGDSIKAIKLTHACTKRGVPLQLRTIFEFQTVRMLTESVTAGQGWKNGDLETVFGAAHTDGDHRALVALKPEGGANPLFCVHPSGGSVGWYLPLTRALPDDRPLYAFQPPGMDNVTEPLDTIEEMAAVYVAEMRQLQPEGPYALLGWSLGGTIAYEMARQLHAAGQAVEPLLLLEPSLPGNEVATERLRTELSQYMHGAELIDRMLAAPDGGPQRARLERELTLFLEEAGFSRAEMTLGESLPLRTCGLMLSALLDYQPGGYPGEAYLLATDECVNASPEQPSGISNASYANYLDGWRALVCGGLRSTHVPGLHTTMLNAKQAQELASWCESVMGR